LGILLLAAGGTVSAVAQDATWAENLSLKGDLRLRHEIIDQEDRDTRNRWRLRARIGMTGTVNEQIDVHVRLASGSDDPVSTNQSLDDGFSTKDFGLDLAYIDWRPEVLGGASLFGGKMDMPFITVKDLIWDGDLTPEGVAISSQYGEELTLMLNAAAFWAEERSSDSDTMLYGLQAAGALDATDAVALTGGATYYLWDNMQGFAPLFDDADGFGNTLVPVSDEEDAAEVYANDYGVLEFFLTANIDTGRLPLKLYGDYIVNTEAETDGDTGFMFGATLGKAKEIHSWALDYNYRDLEADATVGAFTDSDSFGGGTNGEGHKFSGTYQLAKNWQTGVSLFLNKQEPDGADTDYTRAQFDLIAKF
jgi:hypothetical protein